MAGIRFLDHTDEIKELIESISPAALEEVAGELESAVKRNTAVDTGQTKNSWQHNVAQAGEGYTAAIGSSLENAIWEEFGTGDYALNGDGRQGGWGYQDEKGDWHFTHGKPPRRPFWNAYNELKDKLIKYIQDQFKGGLS